MLKEDIFSVDLLTEGVKGVGLLRGIRDEARDLLSLLNGGGVIWSDSKVVGTYIIGVTIGTIIDVETRAVSGKLMSGVWLGQN